MTIGRMIFTGIMLLILGIISGVIARSFLVAILFPVLLGIFLILWRNVKDTLPKEETEEKDDNRTISSAG